ncbi:P-loop containing nucleoside triphosphate hydrolase protein [Amylocystis lapponica]|nr:P-loop containing nucleoside triphosphate hydrolase protein [Amylocystis lapponica]
MAPVLTYKGWDIKRIRELVKKKFNKRACLWQIKVALALYKGKDVVAIVATGLGKTLSFWIALLMALEDGRDSMMIVVTPLNLPGKQNTDLLAKADISAIAISAENATEATFKVRHREAEVSGRGRKPRNSGRGFEKLWAKTEFTSRLLYFVFDEGHCIKEWGSFRNAYLLVGNLRNLIPRVVPFYVPSATLPATVLSDVSKILHLREGETEHIFRTNDRPDIHLVVRVMEHPASSFNDLSFLVPRDWKEGDVPPPKFLIFFNDMKVAESAMEFLVKPLPQHLKDKIKYFHSAMTSTYRDDEHDALLRGDTWGLCVTDAFGMGLDLPGILLVIQFKATCNMITLWQRYGQGARGPGDIAIALLLVEKKYTDAEQQRPKRKRKSTVKQMRKAKCSAIDTHHTGMSLPIPPSANNPSDNSEDSSESDVDVGPSAGGSSQQLAMSEGSGGQEEVVERDEEHRAAYHAWEQKKPQAAASRGRKARPLDPAMDDFINAESDHLLCDNTLDDGGCHRCAPRISTLCCDLCSPQSFADFTRSAPIATIRQPGKSHLKAYDTTPSDVKLTDALLKWRLEQAPLKFNTPSRRDFGPDLLLPNEILTRIVDCAHYKKIINVESLKRETQWRLDWADEFGSSIMSLIASVLPPPPPATLDSQARLPNNDSRHASVPISGKRSTAADGSSAASASTGDIKRCKPPTCTACGQVGHTKRARICPNRATDDVVQDPNNASSSTFNDVKAIPLPPGHVATPPTSNHHIPALAPVPGPAYPPDVPFVAGPSNVPPHPMHGYHLGHRGGPVYYPSHPSSIIGYPAGLHAPTVAMSGYAYQPYIPYVHQGTDTSAHGPGPRNNPYVTHLDPHPHLRLPSQHPQDPLSCPPPGPDLPP